MATATLTKPARPAGTVTLTLTEWEAAKIRDLTNYCGTSGDNRKEIETLLNSKAINRVWEAVNDVLPAA